MRYDASATNSCRVIDVAIHGFRPPPTAAADLAEGRDAHCYQHVNATTAADTGGPGRIVFDGAPAFPVGPLTFQREDGVLLTFRENRRGEITHFFVNQTVYERLR
jgi:hypothetical protein